MRRRQNNFGDVPISVIYPSGSVLEGEGIFESRDEFKSVKDVPKAVTKLLKEDGVVFPQEFTTKEEFGNDIQNLPVYDEYLDDDKEERVEDIEQVVQESRESDGALGILSKYEFVEDPPCLKTLESQKARICAQ